MVSIHGYDTAYSNLADSDIPNPLTYFDFWIIPEGQSTPIKINKDEYKNLSKNTNDKNSIINKLRDYPMFFSLLQKYPHLYNQLNDYKGSVIVFKQFNKLPNRYDTFQIENMMKYHISKSILSIDQLKNRKLRIKTLLDNQFIILYNKPLRNVGSQKTLNDCTSLENIDNKWIENQKVFEDEQYTVNDKIINKIIECSNGTIYEIDTSLDMDYYQF